MPSFLQIVLAVCICYLIVRGFCAPNLANVRYDLVEVAGKECAKTIDTDDDECEEFTQMSRQNGLDALEALIDKRPVARCKEDVLDFLKSFKANKNQTKLPQDILSITQLSGPFPVIAIVPDTPRLPREVF